MAQRQHLGSCKSIWTKRERSESDREEGWGICLTILLGRRWPGDNALCFASTTMCLTRAQKLSCWGWMPLWPDSFCVHLVFTWESSWGRRHNGFKCLTCAHATMGGLVLRKEERGETLTCPGGSYWGAVSSGARGTHQPWPAFLSGFHSTCLFAEGGPRTGWKGVSRHETKWKGNKVY